MHNKELINFIKKYLMKYNCVIKAIEDDEEVTIKIRNTIITGFVNMGLSIPIDKETDVEIEFYDDIEIEETQIREKVY